MCCAVQTDKLENGLLITDLIKGRVPRKSQDYIPRRKEGESILSEETKAMFKALMGQDISQLNRLLDAGADITARNGQGQTMVEVAQERGKDKTVSWLEHVAGAAKTYAQHNRRSKLMSIDQGVDEVLKATVAKQPRVAAKAVMAIGRMGLGKPGGFGSRPVAAATAPKAATLETAAE